MSTPGGPARVSIPAQGGFYDVDITQAPQAIRHLEEAVEELRAVKEDAAMMSRTLLEQYQDSVSRDAAEMLSRAAVGHPGSLATAAEEGIVEITRLINDLQRAFDAYQRGDEQAGSDLHTS